MWRCSMGCNERVGMHTIGTADQKPRHCWANCATTADMFGSDRDLVASVTPVSPRRALEHNALPQARLQESGLAVFAHTIGQITLLPSTMAEPSRLPKNRAVLPVGSARSGAFGIWWGLA